MSRFFVTRWLPVLALTAFLFVQPASAELTIITTDLGTLGGNSSKAFGINIRGQVVGSSDTSAGDWLHAFIWQDGVMTDLGTLGGNSSEAQGINDVGQVVGFSDTSAGFTHAFIWKNGTMTDLDTLGGNSSEAFGINNRGQVVGSSDTSAGLRHAFIWQNGVMTDLGTLGGPESEAKGINNRGQVVGSSDTSAGLRHAFIWQNGVMTDLGAFDDQYSDAYGINDRGQVVGGSTSYFGTVYNSVEIPFMWQRGVMAGVSGPWPVEGTFAQSINMRGQVVGTENAPGHFKAYIVKNGVIIYLGLTPNSLPDNCQAFSINDRGQVAGYVQEANSPFRAIIWSIK